MKRIVNGLALISMMFCFNSCDELIEDPEDEPVAIEGVWVRIIGASGDKTELAIGGIEGEAANRVYMCELKGSTAAGLYKGVLTSANVIVWDDNLPDTYLAVNGSELEFDYRCCGAIPTYYKKGEWTAECGPLKNTTIKLAVGLKNSELGVTIKNVTVDGLGVPLTILNSVTTAPDCSSNSYLTLPKPAHSNSNGGYYTIGVTYSGVGIDGSYTKTDYMTWYEYYFNTGCNKYKVGMNALNKYDLVPL